MQLNGMRLSGFICITLLFHTEHKNLMMPDHTVALQSVKKKFRYKQQRTEEKPKIS